MNPGGAEEKAPLVLGPAGYYRLCRVARRPLVRSEREAIPNGMGLTESGICSLPGRPRFIVLCTLRNVRVTKNSTYFITSPARISVTTAKFGIVDHPIVAPMGGIRNHRHEFPEPIARLAVTSM